MGQIVSAAAKPKRCNINQLSQLGTPAAGEHILVSYDNSMTANGQGNFDRYIIGDGRTAATELELKYLDDSTRPYIVEEVNKAVADIQPIEITGDVTNAPDEEDLTSEKQGNTDVLKFKDKAYNSALYSGLGRVYLRKNIVTLEGTGKNVLTQAMVNTANTIYHIQYDYDLNGEEITIPEGCILRFDGGSLSNGTLIGQETILVHDKETDDVLINVSLEGTFAKNAYDNGVFYLEHLPGYSDNLSPIDCRVFLQNALNYVANNGTTLIFPKRKYFLINIPEGQENRGTTKYGGGNGLIIPSNIVVDFNQSTIQADTNNYIGYNVIKVPTSSVNVVLKNGTIFGDRDTHIMPADTPSYNKTHEWNYAITSYGNNCKLINLIVGKVRGDGITMTSDSKWNHVAGIHYGQQNTFGDSSELGAIDNNGNNTESSSCIRTSYLDIEKYLSKAPDTEGNKHKTFIPRPILAQFYYQDFVSYFFNAYYYTEEKTFISYEHLMFKDVLTIPSNAKYIRISWEMDNPEEEANVSGTVARCSSLWMSTINMVTNASIDGCEVYECGRNGITPTAIRNLHIKGCFIHDIGGTNNEVGIDFEGGYYDSSVIIEDTIVKGTHIGFSTGDHYIIRNCVTDGVYGNNVFDVQLYNCKILGSCVLIVTLNSINEKNMPYVNFTINSCIIGGDAYAFRGLFNNCTIFGSPYNNAHLNENTWNTKLSQYNDCKIFGYIFSISIYNNCDILSSNSISCVKLSDNRILALFSQCTISAYRFSNTSANFVDCYITITSDETSLLISNIIKNCTLKINNYSPSKGILSVEVCGENPIVINNKVKPIDGFDMTNMFNYSSFDIDLSNALGYVRIEDNILYYNQQRSSIIGIGNVTNQIVYVKNNKALPCVNPGSVRKGVTFPVSSETVTGKCYICNNDAVSTNVPTQAVQDNIIYCPNNDELAEMWKKYKV